MTGSRDPIREYLREVERQRRRRIAWWVLAFAAAVACWLAAWALLVWFTVTFS